MDIFLMEIGVFLLIMTVSGTAYWLAIDDTSLFVSIIRFISAFSLGGALVFTLSAVILILTGTDPTLAVKNVFIMDGCFIYLFTGAIMIGSTGEVIHQLRIGRRLRA